MLSSLKKLCNPTLVILYSPFMRLSSLWHGLIPGYILKLFGLVISTLNSSNKIFKLFFHKSSNFINSLEIIIFYLLTSAND